jgi:hypothetical protein
MKTFTQSRAERGQCDQCEALRINGIYCHETGCPNAGARLIDGCWVKFVACEECGCDVERGTCCDCQLPVEDDE